MNHFLPRTRGRALTLGAGCVACTALLAGVASAASNGTGAAASTASPSSSASAYSAADPAAAVGSTGKLAQAMKQIREQLRAGATHGEVTVDTKKGTRTIEFERGTVGASTATGFQVTERGGATGSWVFGPKTKVRERGQGKRAAGAGGGSPAASAVISDRETVVVVGPKTDGTTTARLVVILPNASAGTANPQA